MLSSAKWNSNPQGSARLAKVSSELSSPETNQEKHTTPNTFPFSYLPFHISLSNAQ